MNINKLRYIAGYWDDTANAYRLGARNYDTDTGRFTQYDPSGQEANPYSYAVGNPVNNLDPTGLSAYSFFQVVSLIIDVASFGASALTADTRRDLGLAIVGFGTGWVVGTICGGIFVAGASTAMGTLVALAGCTGASNIVSNLVQAL